VLSSAVASTTVLPSQLWPSPGSPWHSGGIRIGAGACQSLSLRTRMQGGHLHLGGLHTRDESFINLSDANRSNLQSTFAAVLRQSMYPMRPTCGPAQIYTCFSNKCGFARGSTEAPRVLVLGPESAGKTSLCKILTNYAVRMGVPRSPVYVNLDPSEASVVI
jgi:hypothetical protein